MCFSAQVEASYREYVYRTGARIDLPEFMRIFKIRQSGERVVIPKAMEAPFLVPANDDERAIAELIRAHSAEVASKTEAELFKQKTRLNTATRTLAEKSTKKALDDVRIASNKIAQMLGRLDDLRRTELKPRDSRIYPGSYALVLVVENGERVVRPMRYQCRPAGKPEFYDRKYPGTYNARRDNLEGFWSGQFGKTHGVVIATAFYENVARHAAEGRELRPGEVEENVVLEFRPNTGADMLVACLWSRWGSGDNELLSFAAITDEPPAEVAAAGHDRCIIPIREANLGSWLQPDPSNLAQQYAILDDRERPYYEHRMAA